MKNNKNQRTIKRVLLLIVVSLLFIIWVELAVGICNSPFAGN